MAEKIKKYMYINKTEVKKIYVSMEVSATCINCRSNTIEILAKPWVINRFPKISAKIARITKFAEILGPAGVVLGVGVDLLAAFGLIKDCRMADLDQISYQIKELKEDVNKGLEDMRRLFDRNVALLQFLPIYNKLQAQVEVYEQNVVGRRVDAANLSIRLNSMLEDYNPSEIIRDLKQMHNLITGRNAFGKPLFEQLAEGRKALEGDEFDQFMANLFFQFHTLIALEIRAVRMLRSLLVHAEMDPTYGRDVEAIFKDLSVQRAQYDPVEIFTWYLGFMEKGGTFQMKALVFQCYAYMAFGDHYIKGWGTEPGPKGHWKITPTATGGAFHVTCKFYPREFMKLVANDYYVMTTRDKSDPACQWYFHIVDMNRKVFKLRNVKWPSRFVYMVDSGIFWGNMARGGVNESGWQAQFILMPILQWD